MDHHSFEERNTGFGFIRTTYMFTAPSGSIAVGLFADFFGWFVSFGVLILLLSVALVLLVVNCAFRLNL